MSQRSIVSLAWYGFLRRVLQLIGILCFRVRYSGQHNIPSRGGVLVVSSHQSHFDPPLVGMGCPRRMNYLVRDTLFAFWPFRWLIRSLDAIPIDREGIGAEYRNGVLQIAVPKAEAARPKRIQVKVG